MLIYLIRHGETVCNAEKRYQGALDTPLSEHGRAALRQAKCSPEQVYVSPLQRAAETAEILFPTAEKRTVPDLREMHFGRFEGRSYLEMEYDRDYRIWVDGGCAGSCPGGESRGEFAHRTCAAFRQLVDDALQTGEKLLVIVDLGGTQLAVLERWASQKRDYRQWNARPGAGYVLDAARWPETLELVGEVSYTKEI